MLVTDTLSRIERNCQNQGRYVESTEEILISEPLTSHCYVISKKFSLKVDIPCVPDE